MFEEVKSILENGKEEITIKKYPLINQKNGQVTLKMPMALVLKSGINKCSELNFVFNATDETYEAIKKSKLIIYLK